MQIKVITDLTIEPISVEEIVNYIKLDESILLEDALISKMITSARKLCEKRTNLAFGEKTIEAFFTKEELSFNALRLPLAPHAQIISVIGMDEQGEETTFATTDYWKVGNVIWEVQFAAGLYKYQSYKVRYIAGYGIAEVSVDGVVTKESTESLPEEISIALMKQVASWYDNRDDYVPTLNSEVIRILNRVSLQPWF
jgi:uncharacterized phiE125 gp8 family phage protein